MNFLKILPALILVFSYSDNYCYSMHKNNINIYQNEDQQIREQLKTQFEKIKGAVQCINEHSCFNNERVYYTAYRVFSLLKDLIFNTCKSIASDIDDNNHVIKKKLREDLHKYNEIIDDYTFIVMHFLSRLSRDDLNSPADCNDDYNAGDDLSNGDVIINSLQKLREINKKIDRLMEKTGVYWECS